MMMMMMMMSDGVLCRQF